MTLLERLAHYLNQPKSDMQTTQDGARLSSVLILVGRDQSSGQELMLLTKRTFSVETHKGQVSFPGGFREETDPDLLCTALREAREEIGVRKADIKILGSLSPTFTRQQIPIYPWVGEMNFPYPFCLNGAEVEKLIFLPAERLIDEGLKRVQLEIGGRKFESFGIWCEGELVWGATARILEELRVGFLFNGR